MNDQINLYVLDKHEESQLAKGIWLASSQMGIHLKHIKSVTSIAKNRADIRVLFVSIENQDDLRIIENLKGKVQHLVAVFAENSPLDEMNAYTEGYTHSFTADQITTPGFQYFLKNTFTENIGQEEQNYIGLNERLLEIALSHSPDAFIILDSNKCICYASDHYYRSYKSFNTHNMKGMPVEKAYALIRDEQRQRITSQNIEEIDEFWLNLHGEIEISLSNNRHLRLIAQKLPQDMGYVITTTDITSYNRQKEELTSQSHASQAALEKEKQASAVQKQFVNMVSHEFRTPLTIIDGNAQVLQKNAEKIEPQTVIEKSSTIRRSVARLIDLMEGLLSSNMLATGKFEITTSACDLQMLIENLAIEYQDLNKNVSIVTEITNIPKTLLLDQKIISLILSNLLSNAIKFSKPEGGNIKIHAEMLGDELFLQVSDNGIGIPEAERKKIFDRFYRASNTTGITGSGIGLDLVNQLTSLQNGDIKIYSKENEGTDVSITIPVETGKE